MKGLEWVNSVVGCVEMRLCGFVDVLFLVTTNNRLRTGTDKGNPTV